jgi:flavorubredoxin
MTPAPTLPREIADGIWWLGACAEIVTATELLHSHNHCFLIVGEECGALVDSAMPKAWPKLERDIRERLAGRPLAYLVPTHPELPHMGNTGALLDAFREAIVVGEVRDYHLHYPEHARRLRSLAAGDWLDLGGRRLTLVEAVIRDLPNSIWAHDDLTETLFVSDAHPYAHEHVAGQCALRADEYPTPPSPLDTSFVINNAHYWSQFVHADDVLPDFLALLEEIPVRLVAPAHGGVIRGSDVTEMTKVFRTGLLDSWELAHG